MIRKKTPEIINLPEGKLDEIKARFETGSILEEDKKIILLILSTYAWLYRQLEAKKLASNGSEICLDLVLKNDRGQRRKRMRLFHLI